MSTPIRSLFRAAASLGVLHIGSMGLTFLVGILLARQLGPADLGIYALAMATAALAGMLVEFGLPILALREFGNAEAKQSWGEARGLMRWANGVILGVSAVVLVGFFAYAGLTGAAESSTYFATMIWAILLIPIVGLAKLRGLALLALGHTFAGQVAVLIVRPGLFALALAVVWMTGEALGPTMAMAWQVAAAAIALIVVATFFMRLRPAAMREVEPEMRPRQWLGATIPMGMTEGLRLLQGQLAIFLLGILAGETATGLFRVAEASAAICLVPATILNVVAAPRFARLKAEGDYAGLQRLLTVTTLGFFGGVLVLTLSLLVFGEPLIAFAFGADFVPAYKPLVVLLIGGLAITLLGPAATLANMIGQERAVTLGSAIAVVVQLIVALILIPSMGTFGAALGVISGQAAWYAYVAFRVGRAIGIDSTVLGLRHFSMSAVGEGQSALNSKPGADRDI